MLRFVRGSVPPPSMLQSREARADREAQAYYILADRKKRAQSRAPEPTVDLDDNSVRDALKRLFHGKCAFCERMVATSTYRFRPVAEASPLERTPEAHLYYSWLSCAWENLYPICKDCEPYQPHHFPVRGKRAPLPTERQFKVYTEENLGLWHDYPIKERCLLLDPCERGSLVSHLSIDLSGKLLALTKRAQETISHFNLNREQLCEQRRLRLSAYFDELMNLEFPLLEDDKIGFLPAFDFPSLEFGGLWYLLCRRILSELSATKVPPRDLLPHRMPWTFHFIGLSPDSKARSQGLEAKLKLPVIPSKQTKIEEQLRTLTREHSSLASIRLSNFKGIEQLELQMPVAQEVSAPNTKPFRPALLILGENAAGKSSILEATALALCTDEARERLPVDLASIPLDPELLGARQVPRCSSATVTVIFQDASQRELTIAGNAYWPEGTTSIPPVFAYGAFRQYQKKVGRYSPGRTVINLFDSTALLPNPEKWLLSLKEETFDSVVRALRAILSIEGSFDIMERDLYGQRCLIVTSAGNGQPLCRTPLSLASSGYRSVLAMTCDIIQGLMNRRLNPHFESLETAQAVVLIDEVEAHLHPRWKIQIMRALREALPQVTFIVTTHDPLCLRGMQDGEVIVMQRVASDQRPDVQWPVMVEQLVRLPNVSQLTVEQLLTSDFFSLASTDQPDTEHELANLADLLSARERGAALTKPQQDHLQRLERDISNALPVGSTEVQRLVQEAVVEYLDSRRQVSAQKLAQLRSDAKQRILGILEGL